VSSQNIVRREFLKAAGAGTAAIIVGYSREAGAWVGGAGPHHDPFDHVPHLDGELLTDQASRDAKGTDLGFIIFNAPAAVLRPGSIDDISKMIKFCKARGIVVAARGQGHSTHGQAQAKAGLVIDMTSMQAIHEIGPGFAVVDGGCTWRQLTEASVPLGQIAPALTGYIGLSIAGTLSMGGMSSTSSRVGAQVQNALELTVVTGKGKVEVCSLTKNKKLFNHVLAGLGQCAIIVRAKVKLVPAKQLIANSTAVYTDPRTLQEDIRTLVFRNELDSIFGIAVIDPGSGQLVWVLNVGKFHDSGETPDMVHMTRDLRFIPPTFGTVDIPRLEFHLQVDNQIDQLRAFGLFEGVMHPWFDVFLSDSEVADYMEDIVGGLGPDDVGPFGFVLMFPLFNSSDTPPLFRLPDEELVWLFDVLTSYHMPGFDADFAANKRARNNVWYEMANDLGGTRYPIGTADYTPGDWRRHYGSAWHDFKKAKQEFDPENILTPGPGIFPRSDC